ncbi:hypothetical protein CgunFtcFv8_016617 [Champsocephalus gunnari]|uniref:CMRF35-like molecule 8 n=1 Tax=Champsocephalus gunnari TaxID=52237 RepID=A0AAN8HDJ5_CHAGU|nr:hypothetical protein CgunFtcFv8_016617 [Champsocephalus gunnari]
MTFLYVAHLILAGLMGIQSIATDDGTSYWCAIGKNHFDVKQRFELSVTTGMPSLHVDEQEITAFEGGSVTVNTSTATTLQTATQNASLFTSAEPPTVQPSLSTVIGTDGESLQDKNKSSTLICILSTTLVLLLLVVPTAFFGWRMKKKRNKTKTEVPVITGGAEVERDPDVHYATIFHNPDAASQLKQNNIPEETVTYTHLQEFTA